MPTDHDLGEHLLAAAQEDTHTRWLVRLADDTERKLTTIEVVDAYNERLIDPETYVWTDGMQTWEQLQAVDALVDALHADYEPQEPEAWEPEPQAHAASFEPAPTNRSFFASNEPANTEPNQDSAIFSLDSLLAGSDQAEVSRDTTEDSGLIDLRALAAGPAADDEPEAIAHAPLFEPPIALAQPPAPEPATTPAPPPKSNRALVGALLTAIVGLLAAIAFLVMRQPDPAPVATSSPTASASPASAPEPAVAQTNEDSGEPNAEKPVDEDPVATAEPTDSAGKPDQKPTAPRVPVRPTTTTRTRPPPPKTAKPPAPPPPTGCPCPPDDLMCNMRCATGR